MRINKIEMVSILAKYKVTSWESIETDIITNLVERIKKGKKDKNGKQETG